jgi:hypothetical protein
VDVAGEFGTQFQKHFDGIADYSTEKHAIASSSAQMDMCGLGNT